MTATATAPSGTDFGHDVRLQLWAALGAVEVFARKARRDQAAGIHPQATARRLAQLEAHSHELWDALAAAQAL
ncbi:hypothetical protein [Prauserella endophytica]|uniref:Acyl-CoA dehydrogenase n=1 Tax=Prauserella endophytica TaxID=1592324 RepID=A0ABY2RV07_9PSEU|nr:hypothetical protein [Prauserella endophytica]TKG61564.1 hypothetical protein FCN18_33540 [Prauserella endophytica]